MEFILFKISIILRFIRDHFTAGIARFYSWVMEKMSEAGLPLRLLIATMVRLF